jgi:hypothetical protein
MVRYWNLSSFRHRIYENFNFIFLPTNRPSNAQHPEDNDLDKKVWDQPGIFSSNIFLNIFCNLFSFKSKRFLEKKRKKKKISIKSQKCKKIKQKKINWFYVWKKYQTSQKIKKLYKKKLYKNKNLKYISNNKKNVVK